MSDEFDPRFAALNHAARIGDADARNLATAIACALIYIGDQTGRIAGRVEALDMSLVTRQLLEFIEKDSR